MVFKPIIRLATAASVLTLSHKAAAEFGYTDKDGSYVIDTGSDADSSLIVGVSQDNCDLTSILYRDNELQSSETGSQINSGLGSDTIVDITEVDGDVQSIKVTCSTGTLTHYYVFREGSPAIFMATSIEENPSVGELRYIFRLNSEILPEEYPFEDVSNTSGEGETVEGSDVFLIDGETHSKFYSSERYIDRNTHCVYGDEIHVCMLIPQMESSAGGPFFRDIETNNGGSYTSLYNYMNSGHVQIEDRRMGLQGPYEARFSGSDIPSLNETDLSFFGDLDIEGFVPDSLRGQVSGTVSGIGDSFEKVVHWYNSEAQYWARADSSGAFTSPMMKPGDYSMVLYQTEFRVANTTVQVSEGGTTSQDISSEWSEDYTSIWKIGVYDGQPFEFLNSDLFLRMHPSDDRMNAWALGSAFDVGTSTSDAFPMAIFSDVNNGPVITFDLDAVPNGDVTLRVATTLSFAGGRPGATVNGWESDVPDAPTDVDSRGVTRGAYRGYGDIYEWTVPNDQLNEGSNNVTITVQSGNSGEGFLSPNVIIDAIELFSQ